jgi:hypothetical protein
MYKWVHPEMFCFFGVMLVLVVANGAGQSLHSTQHPLAGVELNIRWPE